MPLANVSLIVPYIQISCQMVPFSCSLEYLSKYGLSWIYLHLEIINQPSAEEAKSNKISVLITDTMSVVNMVTKTWKVYCLRICKEIRSLRPISFRVSHGNHKRQEDYENVYDNTDMTYTMMFLPQIQRQNMLIPFTLSTISVSRKSKEDAYDVWHSHRS